MNNDLDDCPRHNSLDIVDIVIVVIIITAGFEAIPASWPEEMYLL